MLTTNMENTSQIQNWITTARAAGLSDDEILKQLRASGWPEDQISQFLGAKPQEPIPSPRLTQDIVSLAKDAQHGGEISNQPKRKIWLFRHLGLSIGVLAGILVLGGVAFAGWQGYIPIPFFGNNAKLLTQAMEQLKTVKSGEFGINFTLATEPREPGATPLPKGTTNTADSLLPSESTDMIPADLHLDGTFTAFMSTDSTDLKTLRGIFTAKGTYQSSGTTYNADLEARLVASQAYLYIKQFPSFPTVDLSAFTGKWIALNKPGDSTISDFLGSAVPENTNVNQDAQKAKTEAAAMFRIALDTKALVLKNGGSERLDGHATKKIILTTSPDQWQAFLQAYKADAVKRGVPTTSVDDALKQLQDPETMATLRAVINNLKVTVWVDSSNSIPRKAEISLVIVPDDTATKFKDKQIHIIFGLTLDHVNEQPNVEVPKDTISLEDVLGPIMSGPQASARNSQRKSDIGQLRTALALYYDTYNKFPKTIDEVAAKQQFISHLPVPPTADEKYDYTPTADFSGYMLCATLEDEGSGVKTYCRNSGGLTIETDVETDNTPVTTPPITRKTPTVYGVEAGEYAFAYPPQISITNTADKQEYLYMVVDASGKNTGDAVGLKIDSNPNQLSLKDWYAQQTNTEANGTEETVSGFPALRVGRSVYVSTNWINPSSSNTEAQPYIFIISHTDNAKAETIEMFEQFLDIINFSSLPIPKASTNTNSSN
jgi:hypothetical protein